MAAALPKPSARIGGAAPGTLSDHGPVTGRPIETLLIEDSEFDQKRVTRICDDTGLGYSITALDGLDALRPTLDGKKFDLILVDFALVNATGIDAVRRIRAHPGHITTAILMLTGHTDLSIAVEAMKEGCSDFLNKGDLSASSLRRATLNAMEKSLLQNDLMKARGLNDKLSDLVQAFARDSAAEMKPVLLSMMRSAREDLRRPMGGPRKQALEMDRSLRKLWNIVEAMEAGTRRL